MKLLILGHGHAYPGAIPSCIPMDINEWEDLMASASQVTFIDCEEAVQPDIVHDVRNDWKDMGMAVKYDVIVDTIGPHAFDVRNSIHYWIGIRDALVVKDGAYYGWNNLARPMYITKEMMELKSAQYRSVRSLSPHKASNPAYVEYYESAPYLKFISTALSANYLKTTRV